MTVSFYSDNWTLLDTMASSSDDDRMFLTQNSFRPIVSDVSDYHDDSDAGEEEPVLQLKEEPVLQLKSEKKRFAQPKRDIEMVNITRRRYVCFFADYVVLLFNVKFYNIRRVLLTL